MYLTNDRSELIASLLDKNINIRNIVDLGCNDGATLLGLKSRKFLTDVNYHGVDYSPSQFPNLSNDISFHVCDLNGKLLEISDLLKGSDLTLLLDVLEHLHEPEKFLQRLSKILGYKSQLIITVPNASSVRMLYAWLKKDFPRDNHGYFDRTHCSWFTTSSLTKITISKFDIKGIGYLYSKKPLMKMFQKLLPSRLTSQIFFHLQVK